VRNEGARTRRHFDVVAESLRGDIQLIAEGQVALQQRFEELRTELKGDIAGLDRRLMRLEASR
jgi:ubiquinone biosynthesis protein UbiJ